MTFIAILLALLANRIFDRFEHHREPRWFLFWVAVLEKTLTKLTINAVTVVIVLAIGIPALLVYLVSLWLPEQQWFSLLWLLFSVVVLWMSLGPKDLYAQANNYLQALKHHDIHLAKQQAQDILDQDEQTAAINDDLSLLNQQVMERLYTGANDRYFAILFWFVVLSFVGAGPAGAILYRGAEYLATHPSISKQPIHRAAKNIHDGLAWVPAHLLALVYPLLGDFHSALLGWQQYLEKPSEAYVNKQAIISSHRVLLAVGTYAQKSTETTDPDHANKLSSDAVDKTENAVRITRYSLFFCLGLYALVIATGQFW